VTIDGKDQMRRRGRFLWTNLARGKGGFSGEGMWQGEHDGYRPAGIIHRRSVECTMNNVWVVVDDVFGKGSHAARLHWLAPDYPWKCTAAESDSKLRKILTDSMPEWQDGSSAGFQFQSPAGGMTLGIWSSRPACWNIYRAGELIYGEAEQGGPVPPEIRGWRSPDYANKIPALSLAGTVAGELPIRFLSCWAPISRKK
jgi:hypothetical protein